MRLGLCFVGPYVMTRGMYFSLKSDEFFLLDDFVRLQILLAEREKTEYFAINFSGNLMMKCWTAETLFLVSLGVFFVVVVVVLIF